MILLLFEEYAGGIFLVSQKPTILASDPLLKEGGSRCAADG
jgi:hypothetical protein